MKKWIVISMFGAALAALAALSSCGGDPCEELADVCAKCMDESTKSGCEAVSNADNHDSCEAGLTTYKASCEG